MNKGKKWETCVESSWENSFPYSLIYRLPDQQSGYKYNSKNPSDFIGFVEGKLFFIECKTIKNGNTIGMERLTQYDDLILLSSYKNVICGFIIWWQEKQRVAWVDVKAVCSMKAQNKKSINIKMLDTKEFPLLEIPTIIKRVYPVCDLTCILRRYN